MNQIKENGYTFEVGPTLVMMPDIYKEVLKPLSGIQKII